VLLADSLALMRAMNQLDAAQTIDSLGQIFVARKRDDPDTVVVAHGQRFEGRIRRPREHAGCAAPCGTAVPTSLTPYRPAPADLRHLSARWLVQQSHALTTIATFVSLVGKLRSFHSARSLRRRSQRAQNDFGDLIALQTLSPFTIKPKPRSAAPPS